MLQWLGISSICDKYIDVAYIIEFVNIGHHMLIVARVNRPILLVELEPIKEAGDSFRSPLLYFIHFFRKNV